MNIQEVLVANGQEHLLPIIDALPDSEREKFVASLERIDWTVLKQWRAPEDLSGKGRVQPIQGLSLQQIHKSRKAYFELGSAALRAGKVAAVLLAGGQGTRLGSDAPKGCYDIGLTHPHYIFEQLFANLKAVCDRCGCFVPLFVMTSDNDAVTRDFLAEHDYFGYPERYIRFFVQDMVPIVDLEGRLLVEGGQLLYAPNGNGGWYSSLVQADVLRDFPAVEWFNVFAVDNVLQRIADPVFIGATVSSGCNCGAKVVCKRDPRERVGVLCMEDGVSSVIEYYEMTDEMAFARGDDGELVYRYGVILNYLFKRTALDAAANKPMPVHVVKKKVPYTDADGAYVQPDKENAYKFETLILDMVHLMGSCLPFEVVREHEFAPIKNKSGVDSVESARELLKLNGIDL